VGASPRTLVLLLLTEGTLACLSGIALGVAAGALLTLFAVSPLQAQFGITLGTDFLRAGEWLLLAAVLATGILASLLPALRAWRLSLADGLSPRS
jgi:putative ABC transport system permease protein